jgi:hypothetical protein
MRYRVAAIQDADLPEGLTEDRLFLEDWINRALGDADFGWSVGTVMVVVFVTSSLPKAPAASRMIGGAESAPTLALHVVVDPMTFTEANGFTSLALLSRAIVRGLPLKPVRKPQGLDYDRLRKCLVATIEPYASNAV